MLKHDKVIEARRDERDALKKTGVWEVVPLKECTAQIGQRPHKGRWVDVNKRDDDVEVYRSRYVAREIRSQHGGALREGLFAAMPPMFIDISKAYLHADVLNSDIYVDFPAEMGMHDMCVRL